MKIGSRPVYLASVMAGEEDFRCVTITSLVSTQVSPAPEEVLIVLRENSRFLTALRDSRKFCVSLLTVDNEQSAIKYSQGGRDDERVSENPSWDFSTGIPVFRNSKSYILLSIKETVSRFNNVLVYAAVDRVSVSSIDTHPLQYGFGKFQPDVSK